MTYPDKPASRSRSSAISGVKLLLGSCLTLLSGVAHAADETDPIIVAADQAKARAEAQKAAYDAKAAAANASAAAAQATLGPLGSYEGAKGTTTLNTDAGKLESTLLTAVATRKAAQAIADTKAIRDGIAGKTVYVLAGEEAFNFDVYDGFEAKALGVDQAFDAAQAGCPAATTGGAAFLPVAAIGAVIDLAAKLFRTDVEVTNITISPDDLLFARMIAGALMLPGDTTVRIRIPSMASVPAFADTGNPVNARLTVLKARASELTTCLQTLNKSPKTNAAKIAAVSAATKSYGEFLTAVTTPAANGSIEVVLAARQAQMKADAPNALLIRVKQHSSGGTLYTVKNFWTAFGAPVFHVTGGTVASYVLTTAIDGGLIASGSQICSSGFYTAKQVHARAAGGTDLAVKTLCWMGA